MPARPPHRRETSVTLWGVGPRRRHPITTCGRIHRPMRSRNGGCDTSPAECNYLRRTVLEDVNAILLQHATNLLNIIYIHAGDANATLDLAITVLNDLELECDAIQAENDLPAQ